MLTTYFPSTFYSSSNLAYFSYFLAFCASRLILHSFSASVSSLSESELVSEFSSYLFSSVGRLGSTSNWLSSSSTSSTFSST